MGHGSAHICDPAAPRRHPGGNSAATEKARSGRSEGAEAEYPKRGILSRNTHCQPSQGGSPRRARGGLAPSSRSSKQQTLLGADASGKWRVKRAPAPAARRGALCVAASCNVGQNRGRDSLPNQRTYIITLVLKNQKAGSSFAFPRVRCRSMRTRANTVVSEHVEAQN